MLCIPFLKLKGDHFGVDVKRNRDHFGVGIISGSIWGSFRGWDHFGVGIISGAVQVWILRDNKHFSCKNWLTFFWLSPNNSQSYLMYTSMKSSVLFHVFESSSCTTAVTSEYKWARWLNTIDSTDCPSVVIVDLKTLVNGAKFSTWTKALQKQEIETPTLPGGCRKNIETSRHRNRPKFCKNLIFWKNIRHPRSFKRKQWETQVLCIISWKYYSFPLVICLFATQLQ